MADSPQAHEHRIRVSKTARYFTNGDARNADEVWFVIHGYAQLAGRFIRRFSSLSAPNRFIVAPEALNRYYFETAPGVHAHDAGIGATWMTREERDTEIMDYIAYLDTLYTHVTHELAAPAKRIVVLGFSQGAATAARWIAQGEARATDLVLAGGFMPPEIEPSADALRGAALTLLHGRDDRYANVEKISAESDRLRDAGMANRVVSFDGGHEITDAALTALTASMTP